MLWAILDHVVDGYTPVVAGLEDDIDQIEDTVFSENAAPAERIYSLRQEATGFYRTVHPLLGVLAAIERAAAPEVRPYLRDVQDTLALVNEEVAAQRDMLTTVLEANMAVLSVEQARISNRQNATMEQLTILAIIFLPLTLVTGFSGQNFGWLTGHITRRIGKQRVAALQIVRALTQPGNGWRNYPAVRMWRGYEGLGAYGIVNCHEWQGRGYADNCAVKITEDLAAAGITVTGRPGRTATPGRAAAALAGL